MTPIPIMYGNDVGVKVLPCWNVIKQLVQLRQMCVHQDMKLFIG